MTGNNFVLVSKELLRQGKSARFRAGGLSMSPSVKDGDYITVSPVAPETLSVGDIVYYLIDNTPIVHRIIRFANDNGKKTAVIHGDSCYGDPDIVPLQDILGKVLLLERHGKMKKLDTIWNSVLGRIIAAVSPVVNWSVPRLVRTKKMLSGLW
jgi:signal peptidase I